MRWLIMGCLAASVSVALAQGKPEAPSGDQRIGGGSTQSKDYQQQQLEQQRQSNWVDESAQVAGAKIPGAKDSSDDKALSPSAPEIRAYVSRLANAMLMPEQLPSAASLLADADARRITQQLQQIDLREHDNLVCAFREQWKARYGDEFDLTRQPSVMNGYYVLRGQRSPEDAIVVAHHDSGTNGQTTARHDDQDQERIATMVIPANPEQKQPAMLLVLNNEKTGSTQWRMNAPDTLSAQHLQRNLDQRLQRLLDGGMKWPADVREAYRVVSYQVLAALNDQPVDRPRERPADEPKPPERDNVSLES